MAGAELQGHAREGVVDSLPETKNEMRKREHAAGGRGGFSLPEVLVAVAMVGVLSAVTLPAVLNQVNKSEISRVVQDLQNVSQAAQLYRTDLGEFPITTDTMVASTEVGWRGPYLSRTSTEPIETGAGGTVLKPLGQVPPETGLPNFLEIRVTGLSPADAEAVDQQIDGATAGNWWEEGLVRRMTDSLTTDTLRYYPVPIK